MSREQITDSLTRPITRRRVVATGAKLAYAAPLVAATMRLNQGGAAAISGGLVANGGPCTAAAQCESGFCALGGAPSGTCVACLGSFAPCGPLRGVPGFCFETCCSRNQIGPPNDAVCTFF